MNKQCNHVYLTPVSCLRDNDPVQWKLLVPCPGPFMGSSHRLLHAVVLFILLRVAPTLPLVVGSRPLLATLGAYSPAYWPMTDVGSVAGQLSCLWIEQPA